MAYKNRSTLELACQFEEYDMTANKTFLENLLIEKLF